MMIPPDPINVWQFYVLIVCVAIPGYKMLSHPNVAKNPHTGTTLNLLAWVGVYLLSATILVAWMCVQMSV